jgi:hypothetical protein
LLTEIRDHPQPKEQGHAWVLYFRCEKCAQIQIVEELAASVGVLFHFGQTCNVAYWPIAVMPARSTYVRSVGNSELKA